MSSSTWTPAALSSEARPLSGTCWQLVEAQHRVSTLKLVDDPSWNHRITVVAGVMAEECRGLMQEFFKEKRVRKNES